MRLFALALIILVAAGCASQQQPSSSFTSTPQTAAQAPSSTANPVMTTLSVPDSSTQSSSASAATAKALPFTGRLTDGDPADLPPSVAASLSANSPILFTYREELTHDEYHIPLWFSAIDPVTYFGSPLGDYGVSAFASLSITDGERVLGDYTAKVHVSKSYNLYSEPTHQQLEQAARKAVRERIDQKLAQDRDRLSREVAAAKVPANGATGP